MNSVTVIRASKKQSFTGEERRRIVADSYASTLSLNQFAKRSGISPATLCLWRKTIKKDCIKEVGGDRGEQRHIHSIPQTYPPNCQEIAKQLPINTREISHELATVQREQLLTQNEALRSENKALKEELTRFKAYAMTKIYDFEAKNYA